MKFNVAEAQEKFEILMAMAFNGELVLIADGEDVVKLEPLPESVVPGKVWTPEDFSDWD